MTKSQAQSNEIIRRTRRAMTRLARFTNRLQRTQLACGPVTVQQCHALEALADGPLAMNKLAEEVALHQSTLTRVVEKLEEKALVVRERLADNQRVVEVRQTDLGREVWAQIDTASMDMIAQILGLVAPDEREGAVRGLEIVCDLLDPQNARAQEIITGCCCADAPPARTADASPEVGR